MPAVRASKLLQDLSGNRSGNLADVAAPLGPRSGRSAVGSGAPGSSMSVVTMAGLPCPCPAIVPLLSPGETFSSAFRLVRSPAPVSSGPSVVLGVEGMLRFLSFRVPRNQHSAWTIGFKAMRDTWLAGSGSSGGGSRTGQSIRSTAVEDTDVSEDNLALNDAPLGRLPASRQPRRRLSKHQCRGGVAAPFSLARLWRLDATSSSRMCWVASIVGRSYSVILFGGITARSSLRARGMPFWRIQMPCTTTPS